MKPSRKPPSGTDDLFRSRLENIIDMGHLLVRLGAAIDWAFFDDAYDAFYSEEGRPGIPTRMMVGVHILKHMFDLSDEGVCERWVYDPYFQYFCGEEYFQFELSIERSSMTRWRDRIGPQGLEKVFQESLARGPPHRRLAHQGPQKGDGGYHRSGEGDHLPHRRQAHAQGPPEAGAAGEGARRSPASVLCARRQAGFDHAGALPPRQAAQAGGQGDAQAQDLSRAHHPRHPPQDGP